jgi:L-seryl-tRNA(Ser) seleniumtransferase
VVQPRGPSNFAPQLEISFDAARIGASGHEIAEALLAGKPRMVVPAGENSLTVMPYMMMPGDAPVVAARVFEVLSHPPRREKPAPGTGAPVAGQWDVEVSFTRGQANHILFLEERDGKLMGQHRGEVLSGDVRGTREGDRVELRSSHRFEGTSIGYRFQGTVDGDRMSGTMDLGEYGTARFTARKHWA